MTGKAGLQILKTMVKIRLVEMYIAKRYPERTMRCPVHLCLGQEAVPAVFGHFAGKNDIFTGTYRSHGHFIAKGGNVVSLFAEIMGKTGGCSGGFGGSMHIIDTDNNFYGTSAIVAAGVPIAAGAAFALKYRGKPNVTVCFIGDGVLEEGVMYESVNFAVLHNLPIIFVCENNKLAVTTPLELRTKQTRLYNRFKDMGLAGVYVKKNDMPGLLTAAKTAFERARKGRGPSFIEVSVERWALHVGHEYKGPVDEWLANPNGKEARRCPLAKLSSILLRKGIVNPGKLRKMRDGMQRKLESDFDKASSMPAQTAAEFEKRIFSSGMLSKLPAVYKDMTKKCVLRHKEQSKLVNPF